MANGFPVELVRLVLFQLKVDVYTDQPRTFLKTFSVCKLWRDIGYELLYIDISMTEAQIADFARCWPAGQTSARSLTISISCSEKTYLTRYRYDESIRAIGVRETDLWTEIGSIPRVVQGMVQLESLSLVVPLRPAVNKLMCTALHREIAKILQVLPKSVKHLELDAVGPSFRQCSSPMFHFCHLLRERVSSLNNLRLRLPRLCGELFDGSHFEHPEHTRVRPRDDAMGCTILINTIESDTIGIAWQPYFPRSLPDPESDSSLRGLIATAQSSIASGRFHNPERLSFFTLRWGNTKDPQFSAVNELELAPVTRTVRCPFRELRDANTVFLRYREPDGSQGEAWGQWNDLMNIVEGEVWVETADGCRLPSVYLQQNSRFDSSVVRRTHVLNKDQVMARIQGRLFAKERAEGRQLLRVQEIEDLRVGFVKRDLTTKEVKKALGEGNGFYESDETDTSGSGDGSGSSDTVELASGDEDEDEIL